MITERSLKIFSESAKDRNYTTLADLQSTIKNGILSEEDMSEALLTEGKMKAAAISMAMAITSALVGAGIINSNKKNTYNKVLTNQLTMQASTSDLEKGKADFMFDGNRISYDTNSNTLKINGKKMREGKAVKQTSLNNRSIDAMKTTINNSRYADVLKSLQFECTKLGATASYDANANVFTITMIKGRRDINSVSNAKNKLVQMGFRILKNGNNQFQIVKK